MLTYGSLFTGAGGLELGVQAALPGRTLWHSDIDPGACKVLAHRWPDVPNLGDITRIDWSDVPRVDVLTGGSPCQDVSVAGARAGMHEGTRSNLWGAMREAIAVLRPSLVVWENVRGAYSACAASEMGSCPRCVGDDPASRHAPRLRALGRVLGDLCDLGYDAQWYGLRAADVGAPHGRFRVFVFAWPTADTKCGGRERGASFAIREAVERAAIAGCGEDAGRASMTLLPTPAAYLADNGGPQHPDKRRAGGHSVSLDDAVHALLPTPTAIDSHHGSPSDASRHSPGLRAIGHALLPTPKATNNENRSSAWANGPNLGEAVTALLPTPRATDGTKGGPNQRGSSGDLMLPSAVHALLPTPAVAQYPSNRSLSPGAAVRPSLAGLANADRWGDYAPAIARWERTLGRPAPDPTKPGRTGNSRLNPDLVEWMMGWPPGHVTAVPGVTDAQALRICGNGVVPQQAAAATRALLHDLATESAA